MLSELTLLKGMKDKKATLSIPCKGVTIFVGPNNSGKSLALMELARLLIHSEPSSNNLVAAFKLDFPDPAELISQLRSTFQVVTSRDDAGVETQRMMFTSWNHPEDGVHLPLQEVESRVHSRDERILRAPILKHLCVHLTGRARFNLLSSKSTENLFGGRRDILSTMYHNPESVDAANELLREFFHYEMFVDLSELPRLGVRLSREAVPSKIHVDKSATSESAAWCRKQLSLNAVSDGVQCLASILAAVHANRSTIILLDEPEVFLHPPLVRRLGTHLAKTARKRQGNLFVSTHSADFLLGCVQAGGQLNIVRLRYRNEIAEVYSLNTSELSSLIAKPLLRSVNSMSALFADGAIIAEAEGDRVFYETVFHYREERRPSGSAIHFASGRGKGTVKEIVGPLRKMGVAAAAVVDMDILEHKGEWKALLTAAQCPQALISTLQTHRDQVEKIFQRINNSMKIHGINGLNAEDQQVVDALINSAMEYGIFVVPGGQLESWLPSLGQGQEKDARVIKVLRMLDQQGGMREEELDEDVWKFVGQIISWIDAPNRKGTIRS